jgi:predicted lysophospholipase L1 biosynthesis ABC-type transport system permease subunit
MTPGHDPPLRVAWGQALASLRVRFARQAVTGVGVALGTAFVASVLVSQGDAGTAIEAVKRQWLVGASLLMCLVGVTNAMLMSVAERTREIGTIKCLGASDGFIVRVFLLEALLLGFAGSVLGSLLGAAAAAITHPVTGAAWLAAVGWSTLFGLLLSVLAAIAPAMAAARLPAAAALRVEV